MQIKLILNNEIMKKSVPGGKHASGIWQGGTVILALKRGGRGVIRGIDESIQE